MIFSDFITDLTGSNLLVIIFFLIVFVLLIIACGTYILRKMAMSYKTPREALSDSNLENLILLFPLNAIEKNNMNNKQSIFLENVYQEFCNNYSCLKCNNKTKTINMIETSRTEIDQDFIKLNDEFYKDDYGVIIFVVTCDNCKYSDFYNYNLHNSLPQYDRISNNTLKSKSNHAYSQLLQMKPHCLVCGGDNLLIDIIGAPTWKSGIYTTQQPWRNVEFIQMPTSFYKLIIQLHSFHTLSCNDCKRINLWNSMMKDIKNISEIPSFYCANCNYDQGISTKYNFHSFSGNEWYQFSMCKRCSFTEVYNIEGK